MSTDPIGLVYDGVNGKLYWGDRVGNTIRRSNLDGSGQETVTSVNDPRSLALDAAAQKLYITSCVFGCQILVYDLANLSLTTLIASEGGELSLDAERGRLYWSSNLGGTGSIKWADLDSPSTSNSVVATLTSFPCSANSLLKAWTALCGPPRCFEG